MKTEFENQIMELFGTTDIEKIRELSIRKKRAGRKRSFGEAEVAGMMALKNNGVDIAKIARKYNTSRQTVYTYLKKAHNFNQDKNFVLRINYMDDNELCTAIDVDFKHEKIQIKNYTDNLIFRAFGVKESPTWDDFKYFLEDRCFPRSRDHAKQILREMDIPFYDPLLIIEKTQGRMAGDNQWLMLIKREA